MKNFLSTCILIGYGFLTGLNGQNEVQIQGIVLDDSTGNTIPFASIALNSHSIGTSSNEAGKFSFQLQQVTKQDTLLISFLGYHSEKIPVNSIDGMLEIRLAPFVYKLDEMVVFPLPPEAYIKRAVNRFKENYSVRPFETISFYREELTENEAFLKSESAIIKSYYPRKDTIKNQHKILLHRKYNEIKELSFMKEKREKEYKKSLKKADKKGEEADVMEPDTKVEKIFGGPNMILALDFTKNLPTYLDSTQFENYRYSFENNTVFQGKDVMVIHFKSKGKIDHIRNEGRLMLDKESLALVGVQYKGEFVLPILLKPVLFVLGLRIKNTVVNFQVVYNEYNNIWYPNNFRWNVKSKLIKTHFFDKNERSQFNIGQQFIVQEVLTENVKPIDASKRYDYKKKLEEQVHPEENTSWYGH